MNSLELIMFENSIDELIISDAYVLTVLEERSSGNIEGERTQTNGKKKKGRLKKAAKIVAIIALIGTVIHILANMIKLDIDEEEKTVLKSGINEGKRILKNAKASRKELEKSPSRSDQIYAKIARVCEAYIMKMIKLMEKCVKSGKVPASMKLEIQTAAKKLKEIKNMSFDDDYDFD